MSVDQVEEADELPLSSLDNEARRSTVQIGKDGLPVDLMQGEEHEEHPLEVVTHHEEEEDRHEVSTAKPPLTRTRRFATIMNCLNSLLGAGILSVPNSFTNAGIVPSLVLLIIMALLSHLGTVMTVKLQAQTQATGFPDLAQRLLGRPGSIGLSVMSLLFLITAQLGYLILGGDMIISWFALGGIDLSNMWYRAAVIAVYAVCFPIALTLPKKTTYLKYISTTTVGCILFFDISLVVKAAIQFKNEGVAKDILWWKFDVTLFSSLSIYGLAFALPVVVLPVISTYNHDLHKRNVVSMAAITTCFVLVLIPGIFGYLSFGQSTNSNILKNYKDNDILMVIVRGAFLLVVSFAYVAVGQSTLVAWSEIIFRDSRAKQLPLCKRIVIILVSNLPQLLIAMFLANAKPALSIGGAMGGCMADFFFPALMWIKNSEYPLRHWQNILCIIFAIFGLVTTVIATYQAVVDAISSFKTTK